MCIPKIVIDVSICTPSFKSVCLVCTPFVICVYVSPSSSNGAHHKMVPCSTILWNIWPPSHHTPHSNFARDPYQLSLYSSSLYSRASRQGMSTQARATCICSHNIPNTARNIVRNEYTVCVCQNKITPIPNKKQKAVEMTRL